MNIEARLRKLERNTLNPVPAFTVQLHDGTTEVAYGYGLLTIAWDIRRVFCDSRQPCALEPLALLAALRPDVEILTTKDL